MCIFVLLLCLYLLFLHLHNLFYLLQVCYWAQDRRVCCQIDLWPKCANCNKSCTGKKRCSNCKSIVYCSRKCQETYWPLHKTQCNLIAKQKFELHFKWALAAAQQGHTVGQAHTAECYENGWGVDSNETSAFEWSMKAAEHEDSISQFKIGQYFENGTWT